MGLDLGEKTLGVALSDALGMMAMPKETFTFKTAHYKHALEFVLNYIEKEQISTVVLGLPKNMDNSEGPRAQISRNFKAKLEAETTTPIVLWDERLTTKVAQDVLIAGGVRREKRKSHVDTMAATLILQNYLDATKN